MADRLAHLIEALQAHGHRLTPARRQVLAALVESEGHVSADDLVEMARRQPPRVGRMTVYRTLDLLSALGLIRPVYQGTGAAHYILLHDGHHHHLVCSACARVIEFDDCSLQEMGQAVAGRHDFQVQAHLLEFYGLCRDCQE
jgi:Fur family ferric uptake transcriptional regulator